MIERKIVKETKASARPRRTPIGQKQRLSVPNQESGYVYRIVNDLDDRIAQMQEQGYEIVQNVRVGDKRVDVPSTQDSSISVGQGIKAFVMRQKKDWYDEDQQAKQAQIDAIENTMSSNNSDYGSLTISSK
jgi:hypothetical protein